MRVCGFIVAQELTTYDLNLQKYYFCGFEDLTIIKKLYINIYFKTHSTNNKTNNKVIRF